MHANLWVFLSIAVFLLVIFLIIVVITSHKKSMKLLEVEALMGKGSNLQVEVEQAVKKKFAEQANRIEILEAIVTDKNYDLNEKITRLK